MRITDVKINYLDEPFIDRAPFVSFVPRSERNGARLKDYRIQVLSAEDSSTVLDTGWNEFANGAALPLPLRPEALTPYVVRVYGRDERGIECEPGEGRFTGAMLDRPFRGKWITAAFCRRRDQVLGAAYLRREFNCSELPRRAYLVICGLGYFTARINGEPVGDDFLATPFTAYHERVLYRVFDVTEHIRAGANALAVALGNGFYNCFTQDNWASDSATWRDVPKLLAELHLFDTDGGTKVIVTDRGWRSSDGPNTLNGIRHGEYYDARRELGGWDRSGYDDSEWQPARPCRPPGGRLGVMEMEPIRVFRKLKPLSRRRVTNGWLFDFGMVQTGVAAINFRGLRGEEITVRYSDLLDEAGELDQKPLSGFVKNHRFQTDVYTKKSDAPELWHGTFAYHGFRYLEISGGAEPEIGDVEAWSLANDLSVRGSFGCSDENINRIQEITVNSSRSMLFSVMNADTVREKLSWTGDTALSCEQMLFNFGAEAFFTKTMDDLRDAQRPNGMLPCIIPTPGWGYTFANGPDWSHIIYEIPLQLYRQSGDTRTMAANYAALCRYVDFLGTMAEEHIVSYGLGDWCAPFDGPALAVNMASFKCPVPVTDTAYYYAAVRATASFAEILGYGEDAAEYTALAAEIRRAFRANFYDAATATVRGDCQTATAIMAQMGLAEADEVPLLIERLKQQIAENDGKLDFGVLGMKAVLEALGANGEAQLAADLLTRPDYPSITHWINRGATGLWECWNGGGSRNHHMFSHVSAFFYKYIAGIRPATPGYGQIIFQPLLTGKIDSARASIETVRGTVACGFRRDKDGFAVTAQVPVTSTARLCLPATYGGKRTADHLRRNGTLIAIDEYEETGGELWLALASGRYELIFATGD